MAKPNQNVFIAISTFLLIITTTMSSQDDYTFSRDLLGFETGEPKSTHLRFFFHDTVSGENMTAVVVATAPPPPAGSVPNPAGFGTLRVMDDPLTVGPDRGSRQVGSAQGIYVAADRTKTGLLMVQNYVFFEGKYNGSTISVMGRNAGIWSIREMVIVGGTGVFRFAKGFARVKTHNFETKTGYAVMEYNVYVSHYE